MYLFFMRLERCRTIYEISQASSFKEGGIVISYSAPMEDRHFRPLMFLFKFNFGIFGIPCDEGNLLIPSPKE